jgi:hypothetical protein
MALKRKIVLRAHAEPAYNEDRATVEVILPGHLLEIVTATTCQKNKAAGADIARAFAIERSEIGRDIDQPYAIDDQVHEFVGQQGDRVLALIPSGQVIAAGDYLSADNDGHLVLASGTRLARSLEDLNAVKADTRIRVELI